MRILIAEDEADLLNILVKRLKAEGYGVDGCDNGNDASYYLTSTDYDVAILDIMMPGKNGLNVLQELRASGKTFPVLLLTAKDSIEDRVTGLDAGADDYLTKPFSFEELLARIRVLLRRNSSTKSNLLTVSDLSLDLSTHIVTRAGTTIELSAREFSMLECLMRNQGSVLSRGQLEHHVWDYDFEGGSNIIDVYVRYLRRKIDDPFEKKLIQTVRGVGYTMKEKDT